MVLGRWVKTPRQEQEEWSNQPMGANINRELMSGRPTWKERHPEVSKHCMVGKILGANFTHRPERRWPYR